MCFIVVSLPSPCILLRPALPSLPPQLPMREGLHLWWTPPAEPPAAGVFAGLRVHLHGARQFTQPFGQLLLHAGEMWAGWQGAGIGAKPSLVC